MDREAVEILLRRNLEISMDRDAIEMLSRRHKAQEKSSIDRESVEDLSRPEKESSIERNLLRMCQVVVELEERRFLKKRKTQGDECNKQATQTNIQATY